MKDYNAIINNILERRPNMYEEKRETKTVRSGGIGFCGLLAIVFITLKLAQIGPVAAWSWWWVLSPLWIPAAISIVILMICCIVLAVFGDN